jgi:hypothetical protein
MIAPVPVTYLASLIEDDGSVTAVVPSPTNPRFIGITFMGDPEKPGLAAVYGGDDARQVGEDSQRLYARVGSSVRVRESDDATVTEAGTLYSRVW